ncbi:methylmalonyl Co-A mutase-associated GTPase MeaB [Chondrinema litorale]|uniref:methylmalonyl Co-A mutase-associated GTPase MeaB n=1 Tax=Chondrinema litorale TaxID=2994555 RepID=UPI002544335A|nr:methylmalonyl Co-A mutase-associated GTPase MeaB [Chondrinema litorale]UZR92370.1 methylmalonyl Co-A mutase-associated GTPase MeaB [Chondrinema litorale]
MRKKQLTEEAYVSGIKEGNRFILSRAITLVESNLPADIELAQKIIRHFSRDKEKTIRIGVTGVPGVGKSTFIESFGEMVAEKGLKVAVLAVDPSSQVTKGSIMGDKTRMETLSNHPNAYIRPSASGSSIGGVARKTREAMLLCEAAGFDVIIVETVGVGQSETTVKGMVDFFLLLMLAGAGDELQGIKKGIMEMADCVTINKADGDNKKKAMRAKREYANALHLFRQEEHGWHCSVITCSAIEREGINNVWEEVEKFVDVRKQVGYFSENRKKQRLEWMKESIEDELMQLFYRNDAVKGHLQETKEKVMDGYLPAYSGASELIKLFTGRE